MELNKFIEVSSGLPQTQQQASMVQDNANKTVFALKMIERLPQEQPKQPENPRIPSLGAMAVPN